MLAQLREAAPLYGRDVMNALEGVVYATDLNGTLTFVAETAWDEFANGNGGLGLSSDVVLGVSLFDMIDGDEMRDAYRALHDDIVSGARSRVVFAYHCDAPGLERIMRMSVTRLEAHGRAVGVLYQSVLLEERIRPPASMWLRGSGAGSPAAPTVAFCSSCARVAWRDPRKVRDNVTWMSIADFHAHGGPDPASPAQHICPECKDALAN